MIVSVIYFLVSLLLLSTVVGVVFPRIYPHLLMSAMAFCSMLVAMFIPQFIMLGLVVTLLFDLGGALNHTIGQVGLGIHLLCWAVMTGLLVRMHRSLPLLDGQPVTDADQPFCHGMTEEELKSLEPGQITWRPSFTFQIPEMKQVKVQRDIIFKQIGKIKLRLDVYRSHDGDEVRPAAMYIHGGAWITGNRRQSQYMCYELASAGWVVFAVSYRFAPRYPLPAAIEDCKAALVWVKQHAAEYGADPDHLVVMGGSAGGHLAGMVALSANEPRLQPGFEQEDTRVQGAVIFYGVPDFVSAFDERRHPGMALILEQVVFRKRFRDAPDLFRLAQPITYASAEAPPILLIHGMNDAVVPCEESRVFARKLRQAGAKEVHLLEVPGALHAFEAFPSPAHQRTMRVMLRFMESLRGGWRQLEHAPLRQALGPAREMLPSIQTEALP